MVKIKDNVDLKELEKFGFKKSGDFYNLFFDEFNEVIIDEQDRIIELDGDVNYLNVDKYNNIIFDLIQAGLVEKVGE